MKFSYSIIISSIIILVIISSGCSDSDEQNKTAVKDSIPEINIAGLFVSNEWKAPDTASIPKTSEGDLIRYGRALVANTGEYFGPKGKINHFANGMNCQNCHLDAGTKLYANSFSAVYSIYPKLRPRSGTVEHLEKRINDCMERSMNGNKIDSMSREMRAMIAYINWVGKDVKKGVVPKGASVADLPLLDRAADPEKGKVAYDIHCMSCHGNDGLGKLNRDGH